MNDHGVKTHANEPRELVAPAQTQTQTHELEPEARRRALAETTAQPLAAVDFRAAVVGRLLGLLEGGQVPLVALSEAAEGAGLRARSTMDLHHAHVGCSVLLMFEQGDPQRPIVVGVLHPATVPPRTPGPARLEVRYDGGRVLLSADTELMLRCGRAQLTLRQDGRVEVHGETIVSRAAGANKVQGGSVQLN